MLPASASAAAAPAVELAALALGGTAGARLPSGAPGGVSGGRRRAVIDVAIDGNGRPDPHVDRLHDLDDALTLVGARVHAVADSHDGGRFRRAPVDPHVPNSTRGRRLGARLVDANGPQPAVDAYAVGSRSVSGHAGKHARGSRSRPGDLVRATRSRRRRVGRRGARVGGRADELFVHLRDEVAWATNRLFRYDHFVEERRLGALWSRGVPLPHPALSDTYPAL